MTNAQFIAAVQKLVEQRTKRGARTKEQARAQLIAEGIITESGALAPEYGGPKARVQKVRRKATEAA